LTSDNKTSLRYSDEQKEKLDEILQKNGNCSRAKVIKSAIDQVTTGKSDIDFGEFAKPHNSEEATQEITLDQEKSDVNCPHCEGKLHITASKPEQQVVVPSFIPGFRCTEEGCNDFHPNPNYQNRATAICTNCRQFAKNNKGPCPWCMKLNTLQPINDTYLDGIGIPIP